LSKGVFEVNLTLCDLSDLSGEALGAVVCSCFLLLMVLCGFGDIIIGVIGCSSLVFLCPRHIGFFDPKTHSIGMLHIGLFESPKQPFLCLRMFKHLVLLGFSLHSSERCLVTSGIGTKLTGLVFC